MASIKILVVYHKPTMLIQTKVYTPIHAGRSIQSKRHKDGRMDESELKWLNTNMIGDDTGKENIASLNREFCELTALYWAWKNPNLINFPEYLGLTHYRRFFIFDDRQNNEPIIYLNCDSSSLHEWNEHCFNDELIHSMVPKYDIVLPKQLDFNKETVQMQFEKCHFPGSLQLMIEVIQKLYPEYYASAKYYLSQNKFWAWNMQIMKWSLTEQFCKWFFDILFEVHRKIDYKIIPQQYREKRTIAFLSERLFGIFITKLIKDGNHKIKELHTLRLISDMSTAKTSCQKQKKDNL